MTVPDPLAADLATLRSSSDPDLREAAADRVEAELARLREERDACERQYQSLHGRLVAQMERAEAAEARLLDALSAENEANLRCARLQQALDQLSELGPPMDEDEQAFSCGRHDEPDHDHEFYWGLFDHGFCVAWARAGNIAREALAGPDTPADSLMGCGHPRRAVVTGVEGTYCGWCAAGVPADSQEDTEPVFRDQFAADSQEDKT